MYQTDQLSRTSMYWQLPRYRQQWRNICAILPVYLPDGTNGCRIVYDDGTDEHIGARLSWVLDDLLGHRCSSRAVLQKQSQRMSDSAGMAHHQRRLPLLLGDVLCLVPVKARRPYSRSHAADGYVVLSQVKGVSGAKKCSGAEDRREWDTSRYGAEKHNTINYSDEEKDTKDHGTELLLTGDRRITVLDRPRTVRENLRLAALLVQNYRSFG